MAYIYYWLKINSKIYVEQGSERAGNGYIRNVDWHGTRKQNGRNHN